MEFDEITNDVLRKFFIVIPILLLYIKIIF